jgi:hypothetical protein
MDERFLLHAAPHGRGAGMDQRHDQRLRNGAKIADADAVVKHVGIVFGMCSPALRGRSADASQAT